MQANIGAPALEYKIEVTATEVKITGKFPNNRYKVIKLSTAVFDVLKTFTAPTSNGEAQKAIAKALGVLAPGGRSGRAASILERLSPGYESFNGWCAVLVATEVNRRRFFQFNPDFAVPTKAANMITGSSSPAYNHEAKNTRKPKTVQLSPEDAFLANFDARCAIVARYLGDQTDPEDLTLAEVEEIESLTSFKLWQKG
jgi:hypothetical protein